MSEPITVEFPAAREYNVAFEDGVAATVEFPGDAQAIEVNFQTPVVVVNSLESESATAALAAAQGKELAGRIGNHEADFAAYFDSLLV